MKFWQVIIIVLLIVCVPVFSSCELLGIGGKSKDQEYYEQQLQLMQAQQEALQKANEEYYRQLQESLNAYLKQYNDYQQSQQQAQIEAVKKQAEESNKEEIPYN